MDKLEWLFKLVDGMSKPAEKIDRAMNDVATEISKVEKQLRELDTQAKKTKLEKVTDPLKKQRLELQLSREALRQKKEAMVGATKAEKTFSMESAISAFKAGALGFAIFKVADFALSAAGAVVGLTMKLADLGLGFARAGIDAAAFRRQIRRGLEVATGSKEGAGSALAESMFYAEKFSVPVEDMQQRWLELMQGGFGEKEVPVLVQAIQDMASSGQADKVDNITLALRQIKAKGRLQAEELMAQLADAGLNVDEVYKTLATELKTDKAGAMKAISDGKVGADLGIFAVVKSIGKTFSKGGVIGATALDAADDIDALERKLADRPKEFLGFLEGSAGMESYQKFLSNLKKATDPSGDFGQGIIARLRGIFNRAFGGIFDGFSGKDGMGKIEYALDAAVGAVDRLVAGGRVLVGFLKGFADGMGFGTFLDDLGGTLTGKLKEENILAAVENFRKLGAEFGKSAEGVMKLVTGLTTLADKLAGLARYETLIVGGGKAIGGTIADGLSSGMWSKLGVVQDSALGVADVLKRTFTGPDGIDSHSPSRVFMKYGQHVADGFAIGVNQGTAATTGAITDMSAARPAQMSARGIGRGVVVHLGGIHIQMGGPVSPSDADGLVSRLRELLPSVLADAFEQLALEQGAT